MGWVWRDDDEEKHDGCDSIPPAGEACSTRRTVTWRCRTEEAEPGKFLRKCENTEELLRDCVGKPVEVVESKTEYTEDDVTDLVAKRPFPSGKIEANGPFTFPGLRNDIEDIERHLFGGFSRFFEAAEEMTNSFLDVFDGLHSAQTASPSTSRRIPIEAEPRMEAAPKIEKPSSGDIDLSGLAKDV